LFSAALLVASMVGFAGPAQANPNQRVLEGVYTYQQEGLPEAAWSIYPVCVPVVGDLRAEIRDPVACQLTVSSTPNAVAKGGIAKLTGGQWAYNINSVDGLTCPDGSTAPLFETFKFDGNTLTGVRTVSHNQSCGLDPMLEKRPFTLTYRKPLPIPVQQYPLYCEPGGLRRCF
jgi:hypothetical protein